MVKREISAPIAIVYLAAFWFGVFVLFVLMTRNTAPTAPVISWSEEPLMTTTRLQVSVDQESYDENGDKVTYFYQWSLDGEPDPHVGKSWSSKETRKGQVYEVRVIPDDGTLGNWGCSLPWRECAGETYATLEGEIVNSPPRARILFVDPSIDPDAEVAEDEDPPDPRIESYGRRQDVSLSLSCFDPDLTDIQRDAMAAKDDGEAPAAADAQEEEEDPEDPCTYEVAWYPASVEISEDMEVEPTSTEHTLPASTLRTEEGWRVQVIAHDGEDAGDPVEAVIYPEG